MLLELEISFLVTKGWGLAPCTLEQEGMGDRAGSGKKSSQHCPRALSLSGPGMRSVPPDSSLHLQVPPLYPYPAVHGSLHLYTSSLCTSSVSLHAVPFGSSCELIRVFNLSLWVSLFSH